jgi:hypothetical protein
MMESRRLRPDGPERYASDESAAFFQECAVHLTFIGATIVRRDFWLSRERRRYYGCEFIHCGVLFQSPIPGEVAVVREPLVQIRYGVGNWTARTVEVWMFKWPELVWSFDWIDPAIRGRVSEPEPWRMLKRLVSARAFGQYGWKQFREVVVPRAARRRDLWAPLLVAVLPGKLAYLSFQLRLWLRPVPSTSLVHSSMATSPYRWGAGRTTGE